MKLLKFFKTPLGQICAWVSLIVLICIVFPPAMLGLPFVAMTKEGGVFLPVKGKKLVARVTQATTDPPAFGTIAENTLSGTPAWARTGAGVYTLTLTGEWTTGKTHVKITSSHASAPRVFTVVYTSANVITINCFDAATPTAADSTGFDIEIVVFD